MEIRALPSGSKIMLFWLCACRIAYAGAITPAVLCSAAGNAAERQAALPAHLLASIGDVESGRLDPATGRIAAWPWTVNVDGAGKYFDTEPAAASFAQAAEISGARDVDVGCFQISLQHHPGAFASMDAAFDPASNANFAARLLNALKMQSGSWLAAIADYHSAVPVSGLPYQRQVLAAWEEFGNMPPEIPEAVFAWQDASVILEAPAASQVQVITGGLQTGVRNERWLPRVITP
jgi:hypothetical protein